MKKMKKWKIIVAVILALILIPAVFGCSNDDPAPAEPESEAAETVETTDDEEQPEDLSETADEETSDASDEDDSAVLSPEFKKTMDDYEAWFDHYCEVMKKYQEDPSDLELLSEMSELVTEEAEMLDQMENMDESEMNTAELAYYLEVTARIEKKLLEVADY